MPTDDGPTGPSTPRNVGRGLARAAGLALASMLLSSCYLLSQGVALLQYQARAESVERILLDGSLPSGESLEAGTEAFLREVNRIRTFASATLGLAASDNYAAFVIVERDHLADVVNAVDSLSFERHEWWWPFVGRLPYKGYFDRDDALRLAARLEDRGLDVWVRPVAGFSTLGILRDPLYSFMVDYDRFDIANFIIHEQAHATLFLPGHGQFNEEFATFVGDTGAIEYLREIGADSAEVELALASIHDRNAARALVLELRGRLEDVYNADLTPARKREGKVRVIRQFQDSIREDYERYFLTGLFRGLSEIPINNAYIDLYLSYTEDLELFESLYTKEGRSMPAFLDALDALQTPRIIADRNARRLARRDPKAYVGVYLLDGETMPSVE